ncbi:hypothetical protein BGZ73_000991 [Actinomortierella ambigua]|nr:hypothetical protein BGZ73_000991 [Actinomortierella ambigua]
MHASKKKLTTLRSGRMLKVPSPAVSHTTAQSSSSSQSFYPASHDDEEEDDEPLTRKRPAVSASSSTAPHTYTRLWTKPTTKALVSWLETGNNYIRTTDSRLARNSGSIAGVFNEAAAFVRQQTGITNASAFSGSMAKTSTKYIEEKVKAAHECMTAAGPSTRDGAAIEAQALLICPYYRSLWKTMGTTLAITTHGGEGALALDLAGRDSEDYDGDGHDNVHDLDVHNDVAVGATSGSPDNVSWLTRSPRRASSVASEIIARLRGTLRQLAYELRAPTSTMANDCGIHTAVDILQENLKKAEENGKRMEDRIKRLEDKIELLERENADLRETNFELRLQSELLKRGHLD